GLCADARASGQDPAEALLQEAAAQQQPAQSGPAVEAMRLFDTGRHAEAIPFFDRALSDDPDNEQLLHLSLIARAEAGQITPDQQQTLELLEQQRSLEVRVAVEAVHLRTTRARILLRRGRNAKALQLANLLMQAVDRLPAGVDRGLLLDPLHEIVDQATGRVTAQQRRHRPARYLPGRPVPTVEEALARDAERLLEHGDERRAYKADEADALLDVERARRIPRSILTYPSDWPERTARRAEYADGTFYKSKPFRNADGQLVYTAIYDLRDLLVEVPDFTDAPNFDLAVETRNVADRAALRRSSQIFTGYAEDLAAGIPLLQFFGGVDESRIPPSQRGYNERYSELMKLIHDVLEAGGDN
ncbi:MAG: hypothetical protein IID40_08635, partial [Planctomycetes bacterium]|nr:hypothetical protein [Planctomycetota bacterium]